MINLEKGLVIAWLDLRLLRIEDHEQAGPPNGIAYDQLNHLILFTGKRWKSIYAFNANQLLEELSSLNDSANLKLPSSSR